jgi:hypothetical protein
VAADREVAQVAVRLSDVAPDGQATRVSWGVLNLTHREGHAEPVPLEPGRIYRVHVPLKTVAQRFAAGHRIRLSVSSSYFPMIWPAPEPVTLTIDPAASSLELPERTPSPQDAALPAFAPPETGAGPEIERLAGAGAGWRVTRDLGTGTVTTEVADGAGTYRLVADDITVTKRAEERYSVTGEDLASLRGETRWEMGLSRGDWRIATVTETVLTSDPGQFFIEARQRAWEGEALVHDTTWTETIPRKLV